MDAAPFSAHDVNLNSSAIEGFRRLPDGSELIWGLSRKEFGPMSLRNRPAWDVAHNRMQFLRLWDLKIDDVVSPALEHTATVQVVTSEDRGRGARNLDEAFNETDALVTSEPDIILLTTHADCLPVWLVSPSTGWIGMAHVGWRGLLAGLITNLVNSLPDEARSDVHLAIGPGIGVDRYEVGPELGTRFRENSILAPAVKEIEGRIHLDMLEGATLQAKAAGAIVETGTFACTYDNRYLSSYRRDGNDFAPMAAFIVRRS
ncbi:polyphenol oxidase family protein [bacterium]|nr:polyphenol oxidase family protein [bacterium]